MDSQDTRQRFLAGLLVVMLGGVIGWQFLKWWTRPPAVEFDNLKYIRLLTTAVSSRSEEMVSKVDAAVRKRIEEGHMSERERGHFQKLFALARSGQWHAADRKCFEFAEAQLSRSRTKPAASEHLHEQEQSQDHREHVSQ